MVEDFMNFQDINSHLVDLSNLSLEIYNQIQKLLDPKQH